MIILLRDADQKKMSAAGRTKNADNYNTSEQVVGQKKIEIKVGELKGEDRS